MKTMRLLGKTIACILASAAVFFTAACSKKTEPEAFTAQLEDVEGAMFFYSMQHPKLISQGLNSLIAEIPEASYARVLLETYGGRFGYPEFTEIATGSNIGVILPAASLSQMKQGRTPPVVFIKLKEGGKIWNMFTMQLGMRAKKHGEWTMFAPKDEAFATVTNPDAVIARLNVPQPENLRIWARLNGETVDIYKTLLDDVIAEALNKSALPEAEKTAFETYARVLIGEILTATHNGHASVHLANDGLRITCGVQFKPDTPIGTFLRYRSDAKPAVARYVANDSLLSASIRYTPKAGKELSDYITNRLLTVDYPPVSGPLAKLSKDYLDANYWEKMDGCGAMTMDMEMDLDNPKAPKSKADTFVAYSGKFDAQAMKQMQAGFEFAQQLVGHLLTVARSQNSASSVPRISLSTESNAATVEGSSFDAMVINISGAGMDMPSQKTYYGIPGGNLVTASSEEILKKRLPSLLAKKTLPENVGEANPLQPYDIMSMTVSGGAVVDLVCKTSKIDLSDADRQAAFASIKEMYKQTRPARCVVEARQADCTYKVDIPYKFVSASVKLGQYTYAAKRADAKGK